MAQININKSNIYYELQLNTLQSFNSTTWLHQINVPSLVLGSLDDILATLEESKYIADNIPNAKFSLLPNGHHSLLEGKTELINAIHNFCTTNH